MKQVLMASAIAMAAAVPAFAQSEASMTCADYLGQDQETQMQTAEALAAGGGMMAEGDDMMSGDSMMSEGEGMMSEGEGMMSEGEGMMAEGEGMMAEGEGMMAEGEDMEAEDEGEGMEAEDGDELTADLAAACDGHPDMTLGDAMEAMGNM